MRSSVCVCVYSICTSSSNGENSSPIFSRRLYIAYTRICSVRKLARRKPCRSNARCKVEGELFGRELLRAPQCLWVWIWVVNSLAGSWTLHSPRFSCCSPLLLFFFFTVDRAFLQRGRESSGLVFIIAVAQAQLWEGDLARSSSFWTRGRT